MDHNGGSVIAMAGKDCVAIASDLRLGAGAMTVALNFEKVSPYSPLSHDIPNNACAYERRSFL
jgi:20S proteasome alpha/beta subunit